MNVYVLKKAPVLIATFAACKVLALADRRHAN
jgi:hypothetical protein